MVYRVYLTRVMAVAMLFIFMPILQGGTLAVVPDVPTPNGNDGVDEAVWTAARQALTAPPAATAPLPDDLAPGRAALAFAEQVSGGDRSSEEVLAAIGALIDDWPTASQFGGAQHARLLEHARSSLSFAHTFEDTPRPAAAPHPPGGLASVLDDDLAGPSPHESPASPSPIGDIHGLLADAATLVGAAGVGSATADATAHVPDALAIWPERTPKHPMPPLPRFDSVHAAVEALYTFHGHAMSTQDQMALQGFDAVPLQTAQAVTRIMEAHLHLAEVTRIALGSDAPGAADYALLVQAQKTTAPMVVAASLSMACVPGGPVDDQSIMFQYDLRCQDSTYAIDTRLSIDLGGDDVYEHNAGGGHQGAAMLVDLDGDDTYTGAASASNGRNGGGYQGSGFLLDLNGNDVYEATVTNTGPDPVYLGANGGGRAGAGFLLDLAGDDRFDVNVTNERTSFIGANGGSVTGSGFLLDMAGSDAYHVTVASGDLATTGGPASIVGANGGGEEGTGFLLDAGGNDTYDVDVASSGFGFAGANGGGRLGDGFLVDLAGSDAYRVNVRGRITELGAHGGAVAGSGVLVDRTGNDTYRVDVTSGRSSYVAANGGGRLGSGILVELAGDDSYHVNVTSGDRSAVSANGGGSHGVGLLVDAAGNDSYDAHDSSAEASSLGANGGGYQGIGVLLDLSGSNTFRASHSSAIGTYSGGTNGAAGGWNPVDGIMVGLAGGLGLLVAGPGNNTYVSNGTTQGAGDVYGMGVLVDLGGHNTYTAGPVVQGTGLAQGAGRHAGVGILIDRGTDSHFSLLDGTVGHGTGLQGLGLLARPVGETTTYTAGTAADVQTIDGGGLGLRLDHTLVEFEGAAPELGCPAGNVDVVNQPPVLHAHVCQPSNSGRNLINPLTGGPTDVVTSGGVALFLGSGADTNSSPSPASCHEQFSCAYVRLRIQMPDDQ